MRSLLLYNIFSFIAIHKGEKIKNSKKLLTSAERHDIIINRIIGLGKSVKRTTAAITVFPGVP